MPRPVGMKATAEADARELQVNLDTLKLGMCPCRRLQVEIPDLEGKKRNLEVILSRLKDTPTATA